MRLRTWLLTGTSLGMLALAPISAQAQNVELQAAYQNYVSAQESGDAAAVEQARASLTEMCIVAGYPSLDACIAELQGGGAGQPAPAPEEQAVEEPAPAEPAAEAAPEEPAPEAAPEPAAEQPAPEVEAEAEVQPEPEPELAPEPVPAEAETPAAEEAPQEQVEPQPAEAADPAPEQAQQEPAEQEPVAQEAAPEQPAPEASEEPAPEQPAPEAAEPQAEPSAAPADPAPEPVAEDPAAEQDQQVEVQSDQPADQQPAAPAANVQAEVSAQVDAYSAAVADMMSGADTEEARARINGARAEIDRLCADAGFPSTEACLAEYGLELPAVPALDAGSAAEPQPAEQQPAPVEGEEPQDQQSSEQPVEVIENLPEGVSQEDVAPVLDSAKDEQSNGTGAQPQQDGQVAAPQPAEGTEQQAPQGTAVSAPEQRLAPPQSDLDAQASFEVQASQVAPVSEEQGERVEAQALDLVGVPQNVTVVNQSNVTNNTSNNTTINNNENNVSALLGSVVVQLGNQLYINNRGQDTDRFVEADGEEEVYYERLGNGRVRETVNYADGSQVVTVRNRNGDILRRSRITPDGREYVLAYFDDRYDDNLLEWRDPADELPPLRLDIPVSEYVLDADNADEQQIETFFSQPPVEQVARLYSIDEVKRSARVRDSVRRLEVGNLTFDTGSASIGRDQVGALSSVANAMLDVLDQNPAETFLIEGHTDAVGSDLSNLQLSDQRAATIARVLTDFYGVPPENLVTQGYGERYLKVRTEQAERSNRRVTIRRITPLITPNQSASAQ
ncbi:hypothetical protein GCM10007989_09430 [Devosia pacifica]|uniref:OmpA-like domain-containing protein n=1 Tax=Devosia pacifica TaxID=1335967 RepID=A0A918S147_9HYPH|nr:OmpA family protein [Devosia pacifica]GHA16510.1 hypothetical protein GCM10007989_09430 [Devosia pacifica]